MKVRYGEEMVEAVLCMETIQNITEPMLRGCVDKFSSELIGDEDETTGTYNYPDYEYNGPPTPAPVSRSRQSTYMSVTSSTNSAPASSNDGKDNPSIVRNMDGDNILGGLTTVGPGGRGRYERLPNLPTTSWTSN
jgi:hypothetical protein